MQQRDSLHTQTVILSPRAIICQQNNVCVSCTDCVFDETFFFNFKGLSRAEVEEAVIKVL